MTEENLEQNLEEAPAEPKTFDADYVRELRAEAAEHRTRAKDLESRLSEREAALWRERVKATGILRDPSAMDPDPDALDNEEAFFALVQEFARAHPEHAAVTGRVGQGLHSGTEERASLSALLGRL
ncbi:hypothetical protein GCM10027418_24270 [Mariniluteicoccus endophyticus]